MSVADEITVLHEAHYGRLVATLTRVTRSLELAEDVVQDAFAKALTSWQDGDLPDEPVAWLARTARNAAIDRFRHDRLHRERLPELTHMTELESKTETDFTSHPALRDDMLRLIFTCCHPALRIDARLALTLKTICGLNTDEIARAFIVPEQTMAQRIVRAKQKIGLAGIAYRVPDSDELEERLPGVLAVIYLIFNESYLSSRSGSVRGRLADQAIGLGRTLCAVLPVYPEAKALLALMLLQHSRHLARFDETGTIVLLRDQDRTLWDRPRIDEGVELINYVFEQGHGVGRYALQAAIASLHCQASTAANTDWAQIALLYAELAKIDPSPVIELNRAVAVGEAHGPEEAIAVLSGISESRAMQRYHLFHSTKAEMLLRLNREPEARTAFEKALSLASSDSEKRFLRERIDAID